MLVSPNQTETKPAVANRTLCCLLKQEEMVSKLLTRPAPGCLKEFARNRVRVLLRWQTLRSGPPKAFLWSTLCASHGNGGNSKALKFLGGTALAKLPLVASLFVGTLRMRTVMPLASPYGDTRWLECSPRYRTFVGWLV